MNPSNPLTRRSVIKAGLALFASYAAPVFAYNPFDYKPSEATRTLHLYNIHTGEALKTMYWERGLYLTESLKDIAYILRDFRTNDMKDIDPHLLDTIYFLHKRLESRKPYDVISGYRTHRTNEMLYEHTRGVNPNSLHMYGRAIDICLSDRRLSDVHRAAMAMRKGGVGYYPASGFVHIDTGPVKYW